ncbi:MAG: CDP-alcohol phosphatidyltransferase family protein [Proteobacteria bacterium]|nr:CDP-alcohol phosphatidyltransferase family protein [Pseudomonadota bacterium]
MAAVPCLLALAFAQQTALFVLALALALASDVADGWLARRSGCASPLGARLDSWADLLIYAALPLAVWWLWPDWIRAERLAVGIGLVAFAGPAIWGWVKFGRLTSYHTWGAKLSAVVIPAGLALALGLDWPWLFRAAVGLLVLVALEEVAITAVLQHWRSDIPSLLTLLCWRDGRLAFDRGGPDEGLQRSADRGPPG